jgi:hypothetical protein
MPFALPRQARFRSGPLEDLHRKAGHEHRPDGKEHTEEEGAQEQHPGRSGRILHQVIPSGRHHHLSWRLHGTRQPSKRIYGVTEGDPAEKHAHQHKHRMEQPPAEPILSR